MPAEILKSEIYVQYDLMPVRTVKVKITHTRKLEDGSLSKVIKDCWIRLENGAYKHIFIGEDGEPTSEFYLLGEYAIKSRYGASLDCQIRKFLCH